MTAPTRLRNAAGEPLGQPLGGSWLYSGADLLNAVHPPADWGPWRLDLATWVLYPVAPYRYEVDLEQCLTSAQVLDRIMQISQKTWADDATIAGLIRALDDVLNPQANLCSFGKPKTLTRARVRELARQAHESRERAHATCIIAAQRAEQTSAGSPPAAAQKGTTT